MQEGFEGLMSGVQGLLGNSALAAVASDFKDVAAYCRSRDGNLEGIPMFLVLEDLTRNEPMPTPVQARDPLFSLALVMASEAFRQHLVAQGELTSQDISTLLEVLAERHFGFVASGQWKEASEVQSS